MPLPQKSHGLLTTVMAAFLNTYLSFKYTEQSLTYCSFYIQLYNLIFKENNDKTITVFYLRYLPWEMS